MHSSEYSSESLLNIEEFFCATTTLMYGANSQPHTIVRPVAKELILF